MKWTKTKSASKTDPRNSIIPVTLLGIPWEVSDLFVAGTQQANLIPKIIARRSELSCLLADPFLQAPSFGRDIHARLIPHRSGETPPPARELHGYPCQRSEFWRHQVSTHHSAELFLSSASTSQILI